MTVKELKEQLQDYSDDAIVVINDNGEPTESFELDDYCGDEHNYLIINW